MVRHICTVSHDNMVEKMNSHDFAGSLDALCQHVVCLTGRKTSAGVVVNGCKDCGIVQHCLTHDNADVG